MKLRNEIKYLNINKSIKTLALAGIAQWIEHRCESQRVIGSISSQGTCLGCGPRSPIGRCVGGNHTLMFLSLSFSFPSPSLKIKKYNLKKKKKNQYFSPVVLSFWLPLLVPQSQSLNLSQLRFHFHYLKKACL